MGSYLPGNGQERWQSWLQFQDLTLMTCLQKLLNRKV